MLCNDIQTHISPDFLPENAHFRYAHLSCIFFEVHDGPGSFGCLFFDTMTMGPESRAR
jgi:hypothetical protein